MKNPSSNVFFGCRFSSHFLVGTLKLIGQFCLHNKSLRLKCQQLFGKEDKTSPPWVIPLSIRRVSTDKKATEVGAVQLDNLLKDKELPFGSYLSSAVGNSTYSACELIGKAVEHKNLATNVRVRGNRTFYQMPQKEEKSHKGQGHPRWYGTPFKMKDSSTWGETDAQENFPFVFRNGRIWQIEMQAWYNILMHGKRDIAMHEHPFTLIRVVVKDSAGKMVFTHPL